MAKFTEFLCIIMAIAVIALVAMFVADTVVGLIFGVTPKILP